MSPVARPPRPATAPGEPATHARAARRVPDRAVAAERAVVSSPANGATDPGKPIPTATPAGTPREGHERVGIAVGPGLGGPLLRVGIGGYRVNPLEIQPAKIHCPPPREDWLSRERLNGWLDRATSGRLGLIVAEAGFGKTTLLADWALHTRRLTSWYRLEADDRDWLTFIRHLVAGGRELDPEFAPETFRLLHSLGPGGPTPADLTAAIAREMAAFGAASPTGLTLLVDDYHVVDGHPDTDPIMRALLDRTGPGFSIVIATRSMPRFSVGRLRARGGVMTIDGEALCFDMDETSRLFRDAYRHPLDADVVTDLHDRTEGWPALLTLVRTGIEDRESSDPRALVAGLDASRGDLYEFLAEEVMASLSPELQHFLTRVSVLMAVDVASATLVDDRPADAVEASIRESERLGLLTRPDRESPHRFHHLVREFLASRLEDEIGASEVRALHRSIADRVRDTDWYAAAWHYLMAGDRDNCSAVIDASLEEIIATGKFDQVRPLLGPDAGDPSRSVALILRSRLEVARGDGARALELADEALAKAGTNHALRGTAYLNLAATHGLAGLNLEFERYARASLSEDLTPAQRSVAEASLAIRATAEEGDFRFAADLLAALAASQQRQSQPRYEGVSRLNLAGVLIWLSDFEGSIAEARRAEAVLGGLANPSVERVAATAIRAVALAHQGNLDLARAVFRNARAAETRLSAAELSTEYARIEAELGSLAAAEAAVADAGRTLVAPYEPLHVLGAAEVALRRGDPAEALGLSHRFESSPLTDSAGKFRVQLLRARVAHALRMPSAGKLAAEAERIARSQRSEAAVYLSRLLQSVDDAVEINEAINGAAPTLAYCWSLMAEEIAESFDALAKSAMDRVHAEAESRPERWRSALRLAVEKGKSASRAASLLAAIGQPEDASFLRNQATARKQLRPAAAEITRRLARPVHIHDLGAVEIRIGGEPTSKSIRRKVLAFVCYLSSRPGMAANREELLEALWPELAPDAAVNSLHQAIYHWRRTLEPDYREWATANYVVFDGDVVSLDPSLVDTSGRLVWRLIRGASLPGAVDELLAAYTGKYAIDFAYEDWAIAYRESLHSAVLGAVETEIDRRRAAREFESAIQIAHQVLAVDPSADAIELELLRTYKAGGRLAAAAEQYAHYAAFVRDELGGEPPPLDDLA